MNGWHRSYRSHFKEYNLSWRRQAITAASSGLRIPRCEDTRSTMAGGKDVSFHILGDAFVDLLCFLKNNNVFVEQGGDAELRDPIQTVAGGSGVNTATHTQALLSQNPDADSAGLSPKDDPLPRVSLYTALNGDDEYGKLLIAHAEQHGFHLINCPPARAEESDAAPAATGHCLAIVADQERSFLTHRGCIATLAPHHIQTRAMVECDGPIHIHVAGYFNMPHFWNGALVQLLRRIREEREKLGKRTCISLVPQYDATGMWDGGIIPLASTCLDIMILNQMEATRIMRHHRDIGSSSGDSDTALEHGPCDVASLVEYYSTHLGKGTLVVVTRGAEGAIAFSNGQVLAEVTRAANVAVVDPTGAGDAFTAGFLVGFWRSMVDHQQCNEPFPEEAVVKGLTWGCATGTASVQVKGASIPASYDMIVSLLDKQATV